MPLLFIAQTLFGLLSLLILGSGGYLVWSWWEGEWVRDADGVLTRVREDWRLWTGMALLAWSALGRLVVTPLLAKPDKGEPFRPAAGEPATFTGASGSTLHVETLGQTGGPTIILTHGWGLDRTIWGYAVRDLASRFRVVIWDLPGLGRSQTAGDGAINLTDFAADLGDLAERQGGPVVLVGHSIGGMTIQTLLRDQPKLFGDKIRGVVLVNTTHTNPLKTMILSGLVQALRWPVLEPALRLTIWLQPLAWLSARQSYLSGSAHMANRLGFGRYVTRSQLEHTTLLATRNPPGAQAKGNLAMFRWDATPVLPRLTVPALVVGGDADIITKLEASRTIEQAAPGARLEVVPGVNHMGFLERADVYDPLIADFAERVFAPG